MPPPWRAADITDAVIGRSTRPSIPVALFDVVEGESHIPVDMEGRYDTAYWIVVERPYGAQAQVYIWRMKTEPPAS